MTIADPNLHDPAQAPQGLGRVAGVLGFGTVLAILYLGRDVLVPITMAGLLGFLIAPLIHRLRRVGVGHTASIWLAVFGAAAVLVGMGLVIASQFVQLEAALPEYEETVRAKLTALNAFTEDKLRILAEPAERLMHPLNEVPGTAAAGRSGPALGATTAPVPVEVRAPQAGPVQLLAQVLSSVWTPLASAGVVFVILVFVLLEREALRDRFIRLAGGSDLRMSTLAINDAATRLSRFFVSQFAVNLSVGVLVWFGLALLGLSHGLLWGMLTAVLRFVPYIGVWIGALCAAGFAAGVAPGWTLSLEVLGLFLLVELVVSQLVEPQLYGHSTGLSPLSVVIAAIFWSSLWGPVGLVVSTPLTLCLVVAGRYVKALNFLEVLFGDAPALSLAQNFYQRALAGDAGEIIVGARQFLKGKTLAEYCDAVLIPALVLARRDVDEGFISEAEQRQVGGAIAAVLESLAGPRRWWKPVPKVSLLAHVSLGRQLRGQRELQTGKWQGPLDGPAGSVVLCVGLGTIGHDLTAEVLVRVLRAQKIDARHVAFEELDGPTPPGAGAGLVSMVFIVSIDIAREHERVAAVAEIMHHRFPSVIRLALILTGPSAAPTPPGLKIEGIERAAFSYAEALQICVERRGAASGRRPNG